MLFDTSSPGRKRAVQVIFSALAILMATGMVLFGIGGNESFNPFLDSSGSSATQTARSDAKKAQESLKVNPRDEAAALKLARARVQIAQLDGIVPQSGGQINEDEDGQKLIDEAIASWTAYMKLGPAKPDGGVAMQYVGLFGLPTVAKYDQAARALEAALVTREPSPGLYAQLAVYHLVSGDSDKYQQARARALDLSEDADRREEIKKYLDDVKKDIDEQTKAAAEQNEDAGGEAGGEGTTPKLPTLPAFGG